MSVVWAHSLLCCLAAHCSPLLTSYAHRTPSHTLPSPSHTSPNTLPSSALAKLPHNTLWGQGCLHTHHPFTPSPLSPHYPFTPSSLSPHSPFIPSPLQIHFLPLHTQLSLLHTLISPLHTYFTLTHPYFIPTHPFTLHPSSYLSLNPGVSEACSGPSVAGSERGGEGRGAASPLPWADVSS